MSDTVPTPATATPSEPTWAKPSIGIYSLVLFGAGLFVAWWSNNETALSLMIGAVITNGTSVINYYFGSSSGSARKTDLLGTAQKPPTP